MLAATQETQQLQTVLSPPTSPNELQTEIFINNNNDQNSSNMQDSTTIASTTFQSSPLKGAASLHTISTPPTPASHYTQLSTSVSSSTPTTSTSSSDSSATAAAIASAFVEAANAVSPFMGNHPLSAAAAALAFSQPNSPMVFQTSPEQLLTELEAVHATVNAFEMVSPALSFILLLF
jgi:hypothetical protein